jgi:phospholipid transport system substrate-binding protein
MTWSVLWRPFGFLVLATFFAAIALGPTAAVAQRLSGPQQVVENVSDGLVRILREQRGKLKTDPDFVYEIVDDLFLPHVDVDTVSALVLGRHWRTATPEQRQAFNREFKRLVTQTYATAIHELSADGWDIIYLPVRELGGKSKRVVVRTQISRPGAQPTSVDYSMRYKGNRWLAYDVKVEGISLLSNYRSSFGRLVSQKGLDGLIRDLNARNDAKGGSS